MSLTFLNIFMIVTYIGVLYLLKQHYKPKASTDE